MEVIKPSHISDRATEKLVEHLQDALYHLEQSDLPSHTKAAVDGLLQEVALYIRQVVKP